MDENKPEQPGNESEFKSGFTTWIRAVAFILVAVFLPEQVAWAMEYNPLVLWRNLIPASLPSANLTVAESLKAILSQVADKEISQFNLDLSRSRKSPKNLLIDSQTKLTSDDIAQIYALLKEEKRKTITCGVYVLQELLKERGVTQTLQELSLLTLTVDILSGNVSAKTIAEEDLIETSLFAMSQVSAAFGVETQAIHVDKENLLLVKPPFIAQLGPKHYILVRSYKGNNARIKDNDQETVLPIDSFLKQASGYILLPAGQTIKDKLTLFPVEASAVQGSGGYSSGSWRMWKEKSVGDMMLQLGWTVLSAKLSGGFNHEFAVQWAIGNAVNSYSQRMVLKGNWSPAEAQMWSMIGSSALGYAARAGIHAATPRLELKSPATITAGNREVTVVSSPKIINLHNSGSGGVVDFEPVAVDFSARQALAPENFSENVIISSQMFTPVTYEVFAHPTAGHVLGRTLQGFAEGAVIGAVNYGIFSANSAIIDKLLPKAPNVIKDSLKSFATIAIATPIDNALMGLVRGNEWFFNDMKGPYDPRDKYASFSFNRAANAFLAGLSSPQYTNYLIGELASVGVQWLALSIKEFKLDEKDVKDRILLSRLGGLASGLASGLAGNQGYKWLNSKPDASGFSKLYASGFATRLLNPLISGLIVGGVDVGLTALGGNINSNTGRNRYGMTSLQWSTAEFLLSNLITAGVFGGLLFKEGQKDIKFIDSDGHLKTSTLSEDVTRGDAIKAVFMAGLRNATSDYLSMGGALTPFAYGTNSLQFNVLQQKLFNLYGWDSLPRKMDEYKQFLRDGGYIQIGGIHDKVLREKYTQYVRQNTPPLSNQEINKLTREAFARGDITGDLQAILMTHLTSSLHSSAVSNLTQHLYIIQQNFLPWGLSPEVPAMRYKFGRIDVDSAFKWDEKSFYIGNEPLYALALVNGATAASGDRPALDWSIFLTSLTNSTAVELGRLSQHEVNERYIKEATEALSETMKGNQDVAVPTWSSGGEYFYNIYNSSVDGSDSFHLFSKRVFDEKNKKFTSFLSTTKKFATTQDTAPIVQALSAKFKEDAKYNKLDKELSQEKEYADIGIGYKDKEQEKLRMQIEGKIDNFNSLFSELGKRKGIALSDKQLIMADRNGMTYLQIATFYKDNLPQQMLFNMPQPGNFTNIIQQITIDENIALQHFGVGKNGIINGISLDQFKFDKDKNKFILSSHLLYDYSVKATTGSSAITHTYSSPADTSGMLGAKRDEPSFKSSE
ncbi:MAG: cysteine peptidase family C39 domain-containing protein, partial [Candidatus Omnitrophota bacterium]